MTCLDFVLHAHGYESFPFKRSIPVARDRCGRIMLTSNDVICSHREGEIVIPAAGESSAGEPE